MASADAIFFSQQILGHVNADLQAAMVELTSLLDDALDDVVNIRKTGPRRADRGRGE